MLYANALDANIPNCSGVKRFCIPKERDKEKIVCISTNIREIEKFGEFDLPNTKPASTTYVM